MCGAGNYQWKSNQSFAYAISLLCSLCFFSLILRNLTPTQSAGVHVEKPYVCSIVSLYVCVRHSSDDLENCSVQYSDYPQRLKEMKIIAHPTRACGVNIATSMYKESSTVRVNLHAWQIWKANKGQHSESQDGRMPTQQAAPRRRWKVPKDLRREQIP